MEEDHGTICVVRGISKYMQLRKSRTSRANTSIRMNADRIVVHIFLYITFARPSVILGFAASRLQRVVVFPKETAKVAFHTTHLEARNDRTWETFSIRLFGQSTYPALLWGIQVVSHTSIPMFRLYNMNFRHWNTAIFRVFVP